VIYFLTIRYYPYIGTLIHTHWSKGPKIIQETNNTWTQTSLQSTYNIEVMALSKPYLFVSSIILGLFVSVTKDVVPNPPPHF
jgi:hypothetical protein